MWPFFSPFDSYQHYLLGVALGCRASAIIYQNTRVYGDYQLIIAMNASARQLTVQPNATSNKYVQLRICIQVTFLEPTRKNKAVIILQLIRIALKYNTQKEVQ